MKSVTLLFKSILPLLVVMVTSGVALAQFPNPVCSGNGAGKVYYADAATGQIFIMDPMKVFSAGPPGPPMNPVGTPIFLPPGSTALAVGQNYGTGPNPTYYTTGVIGALKYLQYWNGTTWVTTGTVMNLDDIAGSCGQIFGLQSTGFVYRWAGGTSTTAPSVADMNTNVGTTDIAGDCTGGFWIINQSGTPPTLRKYDAAGALQQTYTLAGTYASGGNGLAINGNTVYYDGTDGELYIGTINTTTNVVTFSRATTTAPFLALPASDFASCGYAGLCLGKGALDSMVACADTANVTLTATGPGPYNFTVRSGPAYILSTSGNQATIRAGGPTVVTYMDADCAGVNNLQDTTVIFVTSAKIDAGLDRTIIGCRGFFPDTLRGTISDTTTGVVYNYDWTPLDGQIQSGNTTLDEAIIHAKDSTTFYLTVFTLNGCSWVDSVRISVADSTPKPNFSTIIGNGCEEDTVRFINTTPTNVYVARWEWNFGDTLGNNGVPFTSEAVSPTHIYKDQGIYSVLLTATNKHCMDTFRQYVNVLHPLVADFEPDDDSVCAHQLIRFQDKSTTTTFNGVGPTYLYTFGDGDSSQLSFPTHTYLQSGRYPVTLWLEDGLGCRDSITKYIVVDTIPFVGFRSPDSVICEGEAVNLIADYLSIGNTGLTIDMGDGTIFEDLDTTIYSFAKAGAYEVALTAHYRICPDTTYKLPIIVHPFPGANVGEDTVLCPNGSAIVLTERMNIGNAAAKFLWSTGDTTASILAKDIGNYWARVTIGGCSGTDSIMVNKDCYIDIPNSFTPNGDGVNDFFLPRQFLSRSLNSFKMSIYNRWGQVIYESSSLNGRGWDGKFNDKDQPQGVFVYVIDVSFDNGVKEHYTGNVTLLR